MKKVISYSLFWCDSEHGWKYTFLLPYIVASHQHFFKEWELWIYVDDSFTRRRDGRLLLEYEKHGLLRLIHAGKVTELCKGMLRRIMPIWDESVEYVACRDLDSMLLPRDSLILDQFMQSGATIHCVSDNVVHGIPIMGGMCGFKAQEFRKNYPQYPTWESFLKGFPLTIHGSDQGLLVYRLCPFQPELLCEHRLRGYPPTANARASYTSIPKFILPDVANKLQVGIDAVAEYIGAVGSPLLDTAVLFSRYGDPSIMNQLRHCLEKTINAE